MAIPRKWPYWTSIKDIGGISGWGATISISWDSAQIFLFTPWAGAGFYYEAPSWLNEPGNVMNGYWCGWGRMAPIVEGAKRYKNEAGHIWTSQRGEHAGN